MHMGSRRLPCTPAGSRRGCCCPHNPGNRRICTVRWLGQSNTQSLARSARRTHTRAQCHTHHHSWSTASNAACLPSRSRLGSHALPGTNALPQPRAIPWQKRDLPLKCHAERGHSPRQRNREPCSAWLPSRPMQRPPHSTSTLQPAAQLQTWLPGTVIVPVYEADKQINAPVFISLSQSIAEGGGGGRMDIVSFAEVLKPSSLSGKRFLVNSISAPAEAWEAGDTIT